MMKVSELEGALLDAWVARAEGLENPSIEMGACFARGYPDGYEPHENWAQGGPIIERERLAVYVKRNPDPDMDGNDWNASSLPNTRAVGCGPTPLVAAMRAFVAGKYGDTVPDN
jgi:hypothetical protein